MLDENITEESFTGIIGAVFLWDILFTILSLPSGSTDKCDGCVDMKASLSKSISEPINNSIPPSVGVG